MIELAANARAAEPEAEVPRPLPISFDIDDFKVFLEISNAFVLVLENVRINSHNAQRA